MKVGRIVVSLWILAVCTAASAFASSEFKIGNDAGAREISVAGGRLHTIAVENHLSSARLMTEGEEFRIGWAGGQETTSSQFKFVRVLTSTPKRLEVLLRLSKPALQARVFYWAEDRPPVLRKQVILEGDSGGMIVRWLEVESIKFSGEKVTYSAYADSPVELRKIPAAPSTFSLPPVGQPVFLETAFLGLEFPAGYNWQHPDGSVRLKHYPGQAITPAKSLTSKIAVIGFSRPGLLADTFDDYILQLKVDPDRVRFVDVLSAYAQIFPPQLLPGLAALDRIKHLFGKDGKQDVFDDFTYDAGHHQYRTEGIFVPQEQGLWDVTQPALTSLGMKLGMWTSFSVTNDQLTMDWAKSQGYEFQNSRALCFAGPKFHAAYQQRYEELLRSYDVGLITYDVMGPGQGDYCNTPGHGHYVTPVPNAEEFARTCKSGEEYLAYMEKYGGREVGREGLEAQANAIIDFLPRLRQLRPQIFLDLYASGGWLSPWWMEYWDAVHIGSDAGVNLLPTPYTREALIHNRDITAEGFFYGPATNKFPLWGVEHYGWQVRSEYVSYELREENEDMTHGWQSEMVMAMVARGSQDNHALTDLEMMSGVPGFAAFYRQINRWARQNRDVMRHGRMFGGRPTRFEPFGYARYEGRSDRVLVVVRNPSLESRKLTIPLSAEVGFRNDHAQFRAWTVYPYQRLDGRPVKAGQSLEVTLGPYEVRVIDFRPLADLPAIPMPQDVRFTVEPHGSYLQYRLFLEPGETQTVHWTQNLKASEWKTADSSQIWQVNDDTSTLNGGDHPLPELSVTPLANTDTSSKLWKFACTNPGGYHDAEAWLMRRGKIPAGDRISMDLAGCPWCVTYVAWRGYAGLTPTQYPKDLADQWYGKVIPPGRHGIVLKMKDAPDQTWGVWVYGARRLSEVQVSYEPDAGSISLPAMLPASHPEFVPNVWTVRELH